MIKEKWLWQTGALLSLILLWIFSLNTPAFISPIYKRIEGHLDLDIVFFALMIVLAFIMLFNLPFFSRFNQKYFRLLGDMTYSTYLIHFPVQIIIFLFLKPQGYALFFNGNIFFAYLAIVLFAGRLVFIYIEVPLKRLVRDRFS